MKTLINLPKNLTLWYRAAIARSLFACSACANSASRAFNRRSVSTRTSAASFSWWNRIVVSKDASFCRNIAANFGEESSCLS